MLAYNSQHADSYRFITISKHTTAKYMGVCAHTCNKLPFQCAGKILI